MKKYYWLEIGKGNCGDCGQKGKLAILRGYGIPNSSGGVPRCSRCQYLTEEEYKKEGFTFKQITL